MYCKNQKINGSLPKLFQEIINFDLKQVNHINSTTDDVTYKQLLQHCPVSKRINMIVQHFEILTAKVSNNGNKYPYDMRTLLYALPEYTPAQLLDDAEHIINHQPKDIIKCKSENKCIHFKRSMRIQSNDNLYKDLQKQKEIFNSDNETDFVYIDMLDRLHTLLKHSIDDKESEERNMRFRTENIKFSHDVGVYLEYFSLTPLYCNLYEELTESREYCIASHQFKQQLNSAQQFMKTKNKILQSKANKTDKRYGIKKGDPIGIHHILSIRLYCNFTKLCITFRNCCKNIDYEDITYVDNYWLGRFVTNTIQFYGQQVNIKQEIYNIITSKCSYNSFSVVYDIPMSSTTSFNVASQFKNETGTILQLSPKYSHQPQISTCFNVSTISGFKNDKELLFCGMTTMAIVNIYIYCNGKWQNYKPYVESILYLERIIEQTVHTKKYYNYSIITSNNEQIWKKKHKEYLVPLIKHQILRTLSNYDIHNYSKECPIPKKSEIHEYVLELFEHFCDHREDFINLTHIMEEQRMDKSLYNILFKKTKKTIQINNWIIASIFPNVKQYKNQHGNWILLPSLQLLSLTQFKELYKICTTNAIKQIDDNLDKYYKSKGISDYFNDNGIGLFERFCETNGFDNKNIEEQLGVDSADKCSLVELDDNFPLENGIRKDQRNEFILKILRQCNNNTLHIHRTVELECLIKSSSKSIKDKIILPSDHDWNQNLNTIISYICNKFKIIKNMNDNDWCLKIKNINKIIQDKYDGNVFGELLNNIKGQVTIQIIDSINPLTDNLIDGMSVNEIQTLQHTLKDEELKEEMKDEFKYNIKIDTNESEAIFTRSENKKLSELGQDDFCEWVNKCTQDIPMTKTVQNMMNCIVKYNLMGKVLMQHAKNRNTLKDFIQSTLLCNEVYFLDYFTAKVIDAKIIKDHENNKVAFKNLKSIQLAHYVQEQYYSFPAFAFKTTNIDGLKYCNANDLYLSDLLQKKCGFKRHIAKFLIDKIDKYPAKSPHLSMNSHLYKYNTHKFNVTPNRKRSEFDKKIGYIDVVHSPPNLISNPSDSHPRLYITDDELSDASDATEPSFSYSISMSNRPYAVSKKPQIKGEQLFANYAKKIYKGQNDRHFKRIEERLNRVGIEKLLPYMGVDENKSNNHELDAKYFKSQARLVYKIDVKVFYDELYKDIIIRAFGFDIKFNKMDATKWLVEYELNKLYTVIVKNKITRTRFQKEMSDKDKMFCEHYLEFLPKKRRKKLWQKLKKGISKGKLNYTI